MAWRRSLSEQLIRSLASDYLRGIKDECNTDAYLEYQRRFGDQDEKSAWGTSKKGKKRLVKRRA